MKRLIPAILILLIASTACGQGGGTITRYVPPLLQTSNSASLSLSSIGGLATSGGSLGLKLSPSASNILTLSSSGLLGQTVTIVDDLGDSTGNCVITEVGQARMSCAVAGGGVQQRCEIPVRGVVLP